MCDSVLGPEGMGRECRDPGPAPRGRFWERKPGRLVTVSEVRNSVDSLGHHTRPPSHSPPLNAFSAFQMLLDSSRSSLQSSAALRSQAAVAPARLLSTSSPSVPTLHLLLPLGTGLCLLCRGCPLTLQSQVSPHWPLCCSSDVLRSTELRLFPSAWFLISRVSTTLCKPQPSGSCSGPGGEPGAQFVLESCVLGPGAACL